MNTRITLLIFMGASLSAMLSPVSQSFGRSLQVPVPTSEEDASYHLALVLSLTEPVQERKEHTVGNLEQALAASRTELGTIEAHQLATPQNNDDLQVAQVVSQQEQTTLQIEQFDMLPDSIMMQAPTTKEEEELQLAMALSAQSHEAEQQKVASLSTEFNEADIQCAIAASEHQGLFDLIRQQGTGEQAENLLDTGANIAMIQDGRTVLEAAAATDSRGIMRACMTCAQYPCPTKIEVAGSRGRLKAALMVMNGKEHLCRLPYSVKWHIVFSDHTLERDLVHVLYYDLCHGYKVPEVFEKLLFEALAYYALDHVWHLLSDAHAAARTDEMKFLTSEEQFKDYFANWIFHGMEDRLCVLLHTAR